MKCQACDDSATIHVTEIVDGKLAEYHVCEKHPLEISSLKGTQPHPPSTASTLWQDGEIEKAFLDPVARQKMAAYLLPALCVSLLDQNADVRVLSAFRMMQLGSDARSALGALRDALNDANERVRRVAEVAIEFIQPEQGDAVRARTLLSFSRARRHTAKLKGPK